MSWFEEVIVDLIQYPLRVHFFKQSWGDEGTRSIKKILNQFCWSFERATFSKGCGRSIVIPASVNKRGWLVF